MRSFASLLAGKRVAFWISEEGEAQFDEFAPLGPAGAGAAIVLALAMEKAGHNSAVYTLENFQITVERLAQGEQE